MLDLDKVSIKQMLNNSQGKSSLGLLMALFWGCVGGLMMITAVISAFFGMNFYSEVFTYGGLLVGASASLLGVRRLTADKQVITIDKEEDKQEEII
jgi:hypothetical protein